MNQSTGYWGQVIPYINCAQEMRPLSVFAMLRLIKSRYCTFLVINIFYFCFQVNNSLIGHRIEARSSDVIPDYDLPWIKKSHSSSHQTAAQYPRVISWKEIQDNLHHPYAAPRVADRPYENPTHGLTNYRPTPRPKVNNFIEIASVVPSPDHPRAFPPTSPSYPSPVIPTPPSVISSPLWSSLSPPSYQHFHTRGKPCLVDLQGKSVSCYQRTRFYKLKLEELFSANRNNYLLSSDEYNSCHEISKKKRAVYFPKQLYFKNSDQTQNKTRPNDKRLTYASTENIRVESFKNVLQKRAEEHITGHCVSSSYTLLKPYYLYNVAEELRFIVQEENLEQCQPKAVCSLTPESYLHLQRNCDPTGYGPGIKFHCERKNCYHQLLAWDPKDPAKGPFVDYFEFECCCRCRIDTGFSEPGGQWNPCPDYRKAKKKQGLLRT